MDKLRDGKKVDIKTRGNYRGQEEAGGEKTYQGLSSSWEKKIKQIFHRKYMLLNFLTVKQ